MDKARVLSRLRWAVAARRHRLPDPADRWLNRVRWARLPWVRDPLDAPSTRAAAGPATVLIGPANFAGQGWQWARALERSGIPALAWERAAGNGFGYPADHRDAIAANRASRAWQRAVFDEVVGTVAAVAIEAGRPLFGRLFDFDVAREAGALQAAGVRVVTLWHGTDIRLPSVHRDDHPWSVFADPDRAGWAAALDAVARRNRRRLERIEAPVLVSTPDLLAGVPGALWCPVVVEPERWAAAGPALHRRVPVVVHLPSNAVVKGSEMVDRVLRGLAAEGLVSYLSPRGVPADRMPELVASADIVLDQFRLGIYGVAACEAMAAGRLVVSMVDEGVRAAVRDATGADLPIVQATPDDLGDVLRRVVAAPEEFRPIAVAGERFVREVHDGRLSARVLADALGVSR